jgi:hypothetical protein
MNRILKIPNIWSVGDDEHMNDSLNLDVYPNFQKCSPSNEISKETFKKMLKEIKLQWEEKIKKNRLKE